jgi:opacity protein-like surface antigen
VEKIRKKILNKTLWFFAFVPFMMVGSMISHSYGEEGSKVEYGFSIFGAVGDALHEKLDTLAYGFLPCVDLSLHRNWDLEFEGNYSYWNIRKGHDLYFLGVNANLLFKPIQQNWGFLFLLGGGGLGYDSAGERMPQIGDSHCGGILQAGIGFCYNLGKRWALRVEYRFYHLSEPFRDDKGLNTHTALLGVLF